MTTPTQRLHYFDEQFLRAFDMETEQAYHTHMRRLHNRILHTWGVATGLEVTAVTDQQNRPTGKVLVRKGVAVDQDGQEIELRAEKELNLSNQPDGQDVYVTIRYGEHRTEPTDETGVRGYTRCSEMPSFEILTEAPSDPGIRLVLGLVRRKGTTVEGIDLDAAGRRAAGSKFSAVSRTVSVKAGEEAHVSVTDQVVGEPVSRTYYYIKFTRIDFPSAALEQGFSIPTRQERRYVPRQETPPRPAGFTTDFFIRNPTQHKLIFHYQIIATV